VHNHSRRIASNGVGTAQANRVGGEALPFGLGEVRLGNSVCRRLEGVFLIRAIGAAWKMPRPGRTRPTIGLGSERGKNILFKGNSYERKWGLYSRKNRRITERVADLALSV